MNRITKGIFLVIILIVALGFGYIVSDLNSNTRIDSSIDKFAAECQGKGGQLIEKHYRAHDTCWTTDGRRIFSDEEIKEFTINPATDNSIEP